MMIQLKSLNKIIIFLCLVSILFLSFNAFYKTDDYGFMCNLNEVGIIENCICGYFSWDGRFLSLGALVQCCIIHFFSIKFVFLFWTLCFLSSGFLIQYILINGSYKLDFTPNLTTGLLLSVLLWFISIPILNEVVYWGVGGVYAFDLLVGAIWVVLFLKYQKARDINSPPLFFFFTVLTGGLTQNLTIPLIVLVFISLYTSRKDKDKKKFYFLTFLFLCVGLCFIQFAPGTKIRMEHMNLKLDFSFLQLIKNALYILFVFIKRMYLLLFLSLVIVIVFFKSFLFEVIKFFKLIRISTFRNKYFFELFLKFFKWAIVAVSSITPFIFNPEMSSTRTTLYFVFFMFLFFLELGFRVFRYSKKNKNLHFNLNFILLLFGCGVFLLNISFFSKGLDLRAEINKREEILKKSKGKMLNVKLIDPKLSNVIYTYTDYGYPETPENVYIKWNQELYFNVKINVVR